MSKKLQVFDLKLDRMRPATQQDIDDLNLSVQDLALFRDAVHKDVAAGIAGPFVRQAIRADAARRASRGWPLGMTERDLKEIGETP